MLIRTPHDLGAYIRDARQAKGLTQADLAAKAGVSRGWLVDMEDGKRTAAIGLVLFVLRALDVSVDLFRRDDPVRTGAHSSPFDALGLSDQDDTPGEHGSEGS